MQQRRVVLPEDEEGSRSGLALHSRGHAEPQFSSLREPQLGRLIIALSLLAVICVINYADIDVFTTSSRMIPLLMTYRMQQGQERCLGELFSHSDRMQLLYICG